MNRVLFLDNMPPSDHPDYESYTANDGEDLEGFIQRSGVREEARLRLLFPTAEIVRVKVFEVTEAELELALGDDRVIHAHVGGSPCSINNEHSGGYHLLPVLNRSKARLKLISMSGTCYGLQVIAVLFGGKVSRLPEIRQGAEETTFLNGERLKVWMNHQEYVSDLPTIATVMASSKQGEIEIYDVVTFDVSDKPVIGFQYHPERFVA